MEEKEEEKEKKKEIVADRRADIEGSINGPRESKKLNLSCCEIPDPKVRGGLIKVKERKSLQDLSTQERLHTKIN